MADKARFGLVAIAASLALFWAWPAITVTFEDGSQLFARGPFLIPVVAVIVAAVGVDARRKGVFLAVALGAFAAVDVLAALSGVQAVAAGCAEGDPGYAASIGATFYQAFRRGFPLAVLLVFAGREPWRLWERSGPSARKKSVRTY